MTARMTRRARGHGRAERMGRRAGRAARGGAGELRALLRVLVTEPGSEDKEGKGEKEKGKRKRKREGESEKKREREIATVGFAAATAAGLARALVGDAQRVARNEEKKGWDVDGTRCRDGEKSPGRFTGILEFRQKAIRTQRRKSFGNYF